MQFVIRRNNYRIIATAIALSCFIALVRPSPSVLRAAAMAAVLLSAQAARRKTDSLPALGFAIAAASMLPSGVYVAMNAQVFQWNEVKKNRAIGKFERK
jgi:predicted membrane metal-binding protein